MSEARVCAGATYAPGYGEPRRSGHRIVCAADEDGVTLGVEAGERALAAWGGERTEIDALYVAVQNGSELAGPFPQIIREALGLRHGVRVVTTTADDLGAMSALQAALGAGERALVIAAEAATDPGDQADAGAAALIIGHEAGVAVGERARACGLTHERWPGSEAADERFVAHRQWELLTQVAGELGEFDDVLCAGVDPGLRGRLAADATGLDHGIAGPAMAIVLAAARRPGTRVALVAAGSGQAVLAELRTDADASRFAWAEPPEAPAAPAERPADGPALPLPLESPFFARTWPETLRLQAARCTRCGHVAFPPSQRPICSGCRGRSWEPYELPRTGRLLSALENRFLPSGFGARIVFALGELDGGQSYSAPMPPEFSSADVSIGDPIRLVLRRFSLLDGLPLYSMKFVPEP